MSPEHAPRQGHTTPAPPITLELLLAIGEHVIAAWPFWFQGGKARLDARLREYTYDRTSRIAREHSADDHYSIALTVAYDRDGGQVVPVAVLGTACCHDLYSGPARPGPAGGDPA